MSRTKNNKKILEPENQTPKCYGYLRVSTGKQELENNKNAILRKANELKLGANVEWIEEQVSGTKKWNDRELGKLMDIIKSGDALITSEISRFGRKYLDVVQFLAECSKKNVKVYCTNSDFMVDGSLHAQMFIFCHSISAQIERDMISARTKAALQRKKDEGIKLGRIAGVMVLDKDPKNKDYIKKDIDSGIKLKVIADKYGVTPMTLGKFIKKHNLKPLKTTEIM